MFRGLKMVKFECPRPRVIHSLDSHHKKSLCCSEIWLSANDVCGQRSAVGGRVDSCFGVNATDIFLSHMASLVRQLRLDSALGGRLRKH